MLIETARRLLEGPTVHRHGRAADRRRVRRSARTTRTPAPITAVAGRLRHDAPQRAGAASRHQRQADGESRSAIAHHGQARGGTASRRWTAALGVGVPGRCKNGHCLLSARSTVTEACRRDRSAHHERRRRCSEPPSGRPSDARAAPWPGGEEACRRSGLVWLPVEGEDRAYAAWHTWHDGAVHVVTGGAEQPLPGLVAASRPTGRVTRHVPSKETRGRLVTWVGHGQHPRPGHAAWSRAAAALHATRLNAPDGEEQPAGGRASPPSYGSSPPPRCPSTPARPHRLPRRRRPRPRRRPPGAAAVRARPPSPLTQAQRR